MASLLLDPAALEKLSLAAEDSGNDTISPDTSFAEGDDKFTGMEQGLLLLSPFDLAGPASPKGATASVAAQRDQYQLPTQKTVESEAQRVMGKHGGTTGDRPNVTFHWVQDELLERHPMFRPLPKASAVSQRLGPRWASQFSQGSPQASIDLHAGRLTTRHLAPALGLFETANGRSARMQVPKFRAGPKAARSAHEARRLLGLGEGPSEPA